MTSKEQPPFSPTTPLQPHIKAILVGASSGIGAALARQLATQGYQLALLARRVDLLDELCQEINLKSGEVTARAYAHDVADHSQVPQLLRAILADLGGLDLFVYGAGISLPSGLKKYDASKDIQTMQVNLLGAIGWLSPVAELFQSLHQGQIVAISSVAGDRGRVGNPAYNASKAGLNCYMEALRNRLSRYGVNVLTIKPGFVETQMLAGSKKTFWVISAEQAASDICKAIARRRQEAYIPARWRLTMLIIRHIPSVIFRRMVF